VFVHVPKNAGSSVSRALYGRSLGHKTVQEMMVHNPKLFQELSSFAILRDPLERAMSAWKYCKHGGTAQGWVKEKPDYKSPVFSSFERFATEWLPVQDPSTVDFVLQKQVKFVLDPSGNIAVRKLIMLGDLAEKWPDLIAGLNCAETALPVRNKMQNASEAEVFSDEAVAAIQAFYKEDYDLISKLRSQNNA
jgi:hypothetical protein